VNESHCRGLLLTFLVQAGVHSAVAVEHMAYGIRA